MNFEKRKNGIFITGNIKYSNNNFNELIMLLEEEVRSAYDIKIYIVDSISIISNFIIKLLKINDEIKLTIYIFQENLYNLMYDLNKSYETKLNIRRIPNGS